MSSHAKNILLLLSVPITLVLIYLVVALIWSLAGLPTDAALEPILKGYFNHYGLYLVFVGALIEGYLLLGQYFPGGFIIFLSVVAAGNDIPKVVAVCATVSLAFFIAYTLNYWTGKYGWYRLLVKFGLKRSLDEAQAKLVKQGLNAVLFSYWEPNLASLIATAAGVLNIPLGRFSLYSAVGIAVWSTFWGIVVYSLGETALHIVGIKYILILFVVWVSAILAKHYLWDRPRVA